MVGAEGEYPVVSMEDLLVKISLAHISIQKVLCPGLIKRLSRNRPSFRPR